MSAPYGEELRLTKEQTGRTAVVTGATSGIGRATALLLAELGAKVFVGDVRLDPANDEAFARLGILAQICDVQREADVAALIERAAQATGRLDVLVNNAGVAMVKPITEVSEAEWDRCMDTNLKGAFFGCKHAIPGMRPGGGSIVNVASNAGLLPRAHDPVYSISKAALVALTKSLALCHGVDRIRINAVCPGPVGDTGMMNADLDAAPDRHKAAAQFIQASPLARAHGRMIAPREVAEAILYLASDAAAMVTGTALAIDGGKSLGVPPQSP
jgi:NAD(P)-dependent dehydrogenase (short-subunit alcohol dehydrogenase family)